MEYDIPYPTYIPYIGPNNAPIGVKCQGRVVTCFSSTVITMYPSFIFDTTQMRTKRDGDQIVIIFFTIVLQRKVDF